MRFDGIVRLPLAKSPPAEDVREAGKSKSRTPARDGDRARKRILVVDDNADQANSLGMLLWLMGHDVRWVYDSPAALTEAAEFLPEAALIDIGLPGINGYEVARQMRHPDSNRRC